MFLKKGENKLFFVHIPRSGGRYIKYLFKDLNEYECLYGTVDKYKGVEEMHLHLKLLKELPEYKSTPKFTIVRDPLDRFMSMMTADLSLHSHLNMQFIVSDLRNFKLYLKETSSIDRCYFTNWFKPQYEFIGEGCKIWRYENGFGKSFHDFLYKEFNIVLKVKTQKIIAASKYDNNKIMKLKPEFIKEVKKFYRKDYSLLGNYG